jgi:hypothetical protein
VNGGAATIRVYDVDIMALLWTMGAHSQSSYVGNGNNDRADQFQAL